MSESLSTIAVKTGKKLVFIDLETFNLCLNTFNNLPWQAALLKINNNILKESKDFHIKWDTDLKISEEAKKITGFSQAKFNKLCRPEKEVFEEIYKDLNECDNIIGHNILGFDMFLIRGWCKKHNKPHQHLWDKCIDTLSLGRAEAARDVSDKIKYCRQEHDLMEFQYKMLNYRKRGVKAKLSDLAKRYDVPFDQTKLHDALYDLKVNWLVWKQLNKRLAK
tara:strand:- start:3759 stop:4421 length:663 start_codon:yes stop_codon:yes gene_type:complete